MKQFTMGRVGLVLLATAAVCLSQAAVASAAGGNSANAKLCQKGGWQNLNNVSTGLAFTTEGQCVSYGAQGNAYSSFTIQATVVGNDVTYTVAGFGLPYPGHGELDVTFAGETLPPVPVGINPDGTTGGSSITVKCGGGSYASANVTTSTGVTFSSAVVSPCG